MGMMTLADTMRCQARFRGTMMRQNRIITLRNNMHSQAMSRRFRNKGDTKVAMMDVKIGRKPFKSSICVTCKAQAKGKEEEGNTQTKENSIDFKGLKQLVSMGLGTMSGDITEINLDDTQRTVVMELEANNFEDEDGNPLSFVDNEGWVEEETDKKTPIVNYIIPVLLGAVS